MTTTTPQTTTQPGSLQAWLLASRPATLAAAVVPILVGCACAIAISAVSLLPALATLCAALLIQVGTNFVNDVVDYEKGADTHTRVGPVRVTQAQLLTPRQIRTGTLVVFAFAICLGIYLAILGGWPIVLVGIASIVAGIAYTAGPYPLGYHGLGDVFVFVFFGFVAVCGTAYIQLGHIPILAWWAAIPVGALTTAILCVNNLRDQHTDKTAGKRTLAVRLGQRAVRCEYLILLVTSYSVPLGLAWSFDDAWLLLPCVSSPIAMVLIRNLHRASDGSTYNHILVHTAQLLLLHGILFAIGIALSG